MSGNNTPQKNILLVVLGLSLVTLIFSFIYYLSVQASSSPVNFTTKLAVNYVSGDSKIREDKLNYYNGNNFIQLSIDDGSKKALTEYNLLEDIASVHWLKNSAVFNFSKNPLGPKLSKMVSSEIKRLKSKGVSNGYDIQNMYWHVNFDDGSIKFLTYTDDPFGVSSDPGGANVYFREPKTEKGYSFFGEVDDKGVVTHNIFSSPSITPTRIVGQSKDSLYTVQAGQDDTISLSSFNTSTFKEKQLVSDIYEGGSNHTIYEDIVVRDGKIYLATKDEDSSYLRSIDIDSGKRNLITTFATSSRIEYIGNGEYQLIDSGESATSVRWINTQGEELQKPTAISPEHASGTVRRNGDDIILLSRPYIYIKSKNDDLKSIDEVAIEKEYSSKTSSLERDIYNELGDVNDYFFFVPSGSLRSELGKLQDFLKDKGINKQDVTISSQLGNKANYDVD